MLQLIRGAARSKAHCLVPLKLSIEIPCNDYSITPSPTTSLAVRLLVWAVALVVAWKRDVKGE